MKRGKRQKKRAPPIKKEYNYLQGLKYRIYPNKEQQNFLDQQFGSVRKVYNLILGFHIEEYSNNCKTFKQKEDSEFISGLKEADDYAWLKSVNSQSLQFAIKIVHKSYNNFFKKRSAFPKFHKKLGKQSCRIPQNFLVEDNKLYIPKLKDGIKIKLHRPIPSKPLYLDISRISTGKYYAAFVCDVDLVPLEPNRYTIGIDVGLSRFATFSTGEIIDNPNTQQGQRRNLNSNRDNYQRNRKILEGEINKRKYQQHNMKRLLINVRISSINCQNL